ncbi:MAG TPA: TetR/AcrR family transcriptional regulator [Caulobacter sp.]|nr:TetR/AcrR family transcriptional regulator [Caulobacter sp.]
MIDAPTHRPTVEDRRRQIRDAAAACFRRSGFHGASMAEIAKEANLSVGQIYRYFENKEAIIEAIVEQDMAEKRAKFAEFYNAPGDITRHLIDGCPGAVARFWDAERAALMLEVLAEAARNPKIAAVLRRRDAEERAMKAPFREAIRRPHWSDEEADLRSELIGMMFEGMAVRSMSNPDIDPEKLGPVLRSVMAAILELPEKEEAPDA